MTDQKKKISIVVPCYNESGNIKNLYERISLVLQKLSNYDYEILFVDNCSTDDSVEIFQELVNRDNHVKTILLSRNFGNSQPGIMAGFNVMSGDCAIIIQGDIQDPPELISEFVEKWGAGFDVVYGIAKKRKGSIIRRIGYSLFYKVFKKLSYLDIPLNSGDFCLLDKKVINVIKALPEKDIYIRGLRTWAGFNQAGIEYIREDRYAGKTSNSFFANFWWAKKAIINFSDKPLEYISRLALGSIFITFCTALTYIYLYFYKGAPRGFSTLLMVMFIFGSLQLLCLSVIAEYLIKIFHEVKGRPSFVIKKILKQTKNEIKKNVHYDFKN
jgi:polyisoprenyl-phosphate glycosyltransferase